MFANLALNLNDDKIDKFIAVAPIVYLYNLSKKLPIYSEFIYLIKTMTFLNVYELFPSDCVESIFPVWIARYICKLIPSICDICIC